MVWSQYVYEATHGYDAYSSDENDQDSGGSNGLTIHDFQDAYAYELYDVFGVIETLIRDAYLEHDIKPDFNEFVELCFHQFEEDDDEDASEEFEHLDHARYIFSRAKSLDRAKLLGFVTFNNFIRFLKNKY
jgi:hypothetical protein